MYSDTGYDSAMMAHVRTRVGDHAAQVAAKSVGYGTLGIVVSEAARSEALAALHRRVDAAEAAGVPFWQFVRHVVDHARGR